MMGMGYDKQDGTWNYLLIKMQYDDHIGFSREIDRLMNEDWELHGTPFSHLGDVFQALVKFEYEECEEEDGGDDDDGLPLPQEANEPIEKMRNCS